MEIPKLIYIASITIADAPPPPLQIPATPILPFFCFKILISVTTILDPEDPRGCPKDTAPPLTLTISGLISNNFMLAKPTTENASLSSKKSTSDF